MLDTRIKTNGMLFLVKFNSYFHDNPSKFAHCFLIPYRKPSQPGRNGLQVILDLVVEYPAQFVALIQSNTNILFKNSHKPLKFTDFVMPQLVYTLTNGRMTSQNGRFVVKPTQKHKRRYNVGPRISWLSIWFAR